MNSVYEVVNGMTGMNRNVILRICRLLTHSVDEVKAIIGMNVDHYSWKNHPFFLEGRLCNIPVAFRSNPMGGCAIKPATTAKDCSFTTWSNRTIFLNAKVKRGVFKWMTRIRYGTILGAMSTFYLGTRSCAPPPPRPRPGMRIMFGNSDKNVNVKKKDDNDDNNDEPDYSLYGVGMIGGDDIWDGKTQATVPSDRSFLGYEGNTHAFSFWKDGFGSLGSCLLGIDETVAEETKVPDGSIVAVEVDSNTHTLSFFVNGRKLPCGFGEVDVPLSFGMSGSGQPCSFTSVCFCRLACPTPSAVVCRFYKQRIMYDGEMI